MRLSVITLLFVLIGCTVLPAQEDLAIGDWRSHLPYQTGSYVTQSEDAIYYAPKWSLVQLDKTEFAPRFLSKIDGLSNVGIRLIKYNAMSDILMVVYDNSVIDLIPFQDGAPGRITTMNQIKNFKNISGEKVIYNIHVENDSMVYLAASYGVSKVNIFANEFVFTTFTGVDVNDVNLFEGNIHLATPEGIYRTNTDNINPDDFGNWTWLGPEEGFPGDYSSRVLGSFQGNLYFDINNDLYRQDSDVLSLLHSEPGYRIHFLADEGAHLIAGYRCVSDCFRGRAIYLDGTGNKGLVAENCFGIPNNAVEEKQGRVWFSDIFRGFRWVNNLEDTECTYRNFNSPYSENNREITIHNDQVWIASGAVNQNFSNRFLDHGFFSLIDGQWTIYNRNNVPAINGDDPSPTNTGRSDDLLDFITIALHPVNGTVYAGSFYEGLLEMNEDGAIVYDEKNSSLQRAVGDPLRTRISGLVFDEENNLWISNHSAPAPISVFKNDGSWQSFNISCSPNELHQIDVDRNGFLWAVISNSQAGVVVFDPGALDNSSDDRCRLFTQNNSALPTNNANCLKVDLEGDIWVGTAEGIAIIECGASAFDSECPVSLRRFEQDGFGAYLLQNEEVNTIEVDGANRKWVGTKNGIFVLSPSGEELVGRFTEDNSPLFDNNIIDIAINQKNGEVFIGTNKGVLSYRSDAVIGEQFHQDELVVFPNPVRPEYDGPIAIQGLARDANVKITDVNGKLVFETKALGGQAIWYAQDYNGKRVQSGVYLVFSTSNSRFSGFGEPNSAVAKILVVN